MGQNTEIRIPYRAGKHDNLGMAMPLDTAELAAVSGRPTGFGRIVPPILLLVPLMHQESSYPLSLQHPVQKDDLRRRLLDLTQCQRRGQSY